MYKVNRNKNTFRLRTKIVPTIVSNVENVCFYRALGHLVCLYQMVVHQSCIYAVLIAY